MAVTLFNGLLKRIRGLMGTHNDSDEGGDNFNVESQLQALATQSKSFNLDPSTNAVVNTTKRHVYDVRWPIEVVEVNYCPDGALVVNGTNYAIMSLLKGNGAAAAATTVASVNTAAGSNWAAGTAVSLTLSATAANKKLAAGNMLATQIIKYGAGGVAVPKGALVVHYRLQ
jgi:hypothetical protein